MLMMPFIEFLGNFVPDDLVNNLCKLMPPTSVTTWDFIGVSLIAYVNHGFLAGELLNQSLLLYVAHSFFNTFLSIK